MIYLIDACVLITAKDSYYPLDRVPEFWKWIIHMGKQGKIKMPLEAYEECSGGKDVLATWIKQVEAKEAIVLDENCNVHLVRKVISQGYANDLDDIEVNKLGRDPLIISYALQSPADRTIVTVENSKPKLQRANRKVPDVCKSLGLSCIDPFSMYQRLDFKTDWEKNDN